VLFLTGLVDDEVRLPRLATAWPALSFEYLMTSSIFLSPNLNYTVNHMSCSIYYIRRLKSNIHVSCKVKLEITWRHLYCEAIVGQT
jgi:hypothetical protein